MSERRLEELNLPFFNHQLMSLLQIRGRAEWLQQLVTLLILDLVMLGRRE